MRSSHFLALWAAAVSAQSNVTVLNFLFDDKTLTIKGSKDSTTTYEHACPASTSGAASSRPASSGEASSGAAPSSTIDLVSTITDSSIIGSATSEGAGTLTLAPITGLPTNFPIQTAKARVRRDDNSTDCEPYTIIQGPSTWEFHLTDPIPGAWTLDMSCTFGDGGLTTADATCTGAARGEIVGNQTGTSTVTFAHTDLVSSSIFETVNVVSATAAPTGSVSSSRASGSAPGPASGSTASATAHSTGLAPALPLPTGGVMALVGGAAGIFAAALAL
ncbi:uncharacterized protein BDR25DRAFT_301505 [Lindgomyces ingoldianus]|uniref:Uncharacterized protein n=1 Tax=Lindgomyces ingoldianus TaxID=673940 RepID=A0ACB6R9D1_9PLEO|nr:uncharacterized protein BDR25DRAFT_301505 [Lindgomyces ingoldianus]KAF2474935.1 hypothetical protein BDR25DRAFT_301505 [Lindgomyces ingoldianus]